MLLGVGAVLLVRVVRRAGTDRLALLGAFGLTVWASTALVQHPSNLFVPLIFCAVAVPPLLVAAERRGRRTAGIAGIGVAVLAAGALLAPLAQAVSSYGLLDRSRPLTCYDPTMRIRSAPQTRVSAAFAHAAGEAPMLSVGTQFAARTDYISQRPPSRTFAFVDRSWSRTVGADQVRAGYLRDRTFDYVWIRVPGLDPVGDVAAQLAAAAETDDRTSRQQAAALASGDTPAFSCSNELLLRAR